MSTGKQAFAAVARGEKKSGRFGRIAKFIAQSSSSARKRQQRRLALESLEFRSLLATEIFGTVYEDVDQSGTKTGGDNGLQGWTVYLDLNKDGALNSGEPSAVTNVDGDYSITGIAAGSYRVAEVLQDGWKPISAVSKDVTVAADKNTRADFFVFGGGDITGILWSDLDHDGTRTTDPSTGEFLDPALPGWTVFLDLNNNLSFDAAEPSVSTDDAGGYRFSDLAPGDYEVTEILPTGWEATRKHDIRQTATVNALQVTTLDFGNYSLTNGGIRGTVFNDVNADGVRNTDASTGKFIEPGLEGWNIFIDLNNNLGQDAGEPSALTDSDGEYRFASLDAGDYEVMVDLPSGWDSTPGTDSRQTVSVFGGEVTTATDFANFTVLNGSIGGLVWNDINRNGVRDFNTVTGQYTDPPLPGWHVFIDLNRNRLADAGEPNSITDASGHYTFLELQVGDYEVQEILPSGWEVAATFSDSQSVMVFSGAESVAADFANFDASASAPGAVSGVIWNDLNGNGIREATESGLSGWTVFLDANSNGLLDAGEASVTTPANGDYAFSGIIPGTVSIGVAATTGWRPSAPTSNSRTLTLRGGQNATGLDFGEVQLKEASISGVVFADYDQDGLRDAGDRGLAGITVYLDLNDNNALDSGEPSLLTSEDLYYTPAVDEAGDYHFTHLALGTYIVRAIVPEKLNATPAAELVHSITIAAFENRTNVNTAARFRPTEIRGLKFEDSNNNQVRDAGELPIAGAMVYVDLDRDDVLDADEPRTTTGDDGAYSFIGLATGTYVVRSVTESGYSKSLPTTKGGILWPTGTSNSPLGNVTPTLIEQSLAKDESYRQTVSITLPGSGSLTNQVDVFLLFDDTGSFVNNSPIVRAAFPDIIAQLQTALPGIDLGFGVGRFEEYGNFAYEYSTGRPFVLNQPIVTASTSGYMAAIQAALNRTTPGYGGDGPETDIEALYQLVTGAGFDGNNNGSVLDSGRAGLAATQLMPGASGDVPSFASFTADTANGIMPAAGSIGGAGFRSGALPVILLATDIGVAYQPKGETSITGAGGVSLPISALTQNSRATTPFNSGAGLQETITGLNALGALVIGLGTNPTANVDPRQQLEAISKLTGATNQTTTTIANGTADPIAPGDPFYFQIASGFGSSVSNGVVSAIQNGVTSVAVDIEVRASDPRVRIINHSGMARSIGAGMSASFDVEFIGDGAPRRFDLQFVRAGTNVVLGSIPVVLGTPIPGDAYHCDELEDGEIEVEDDFGDYQSSSAPINGAPSFVAGPNVVVQEDDGSISIPNWATSISAGPGAWESGQVLDFIVTHDNAALFSVAPAISPEGTLTFTLAPDANGAAQVTVVLHDDGGSENGGVDRSAPKTFLITANAVNDAPVVVRALPNLSVEVNSADTSIDLTGVFADVDDATLSLSVTSDAPSIVAATISGMTLTLHYAPNSLGAARITIVATDSSGLTAANPFTATIQNSLPTLTVTGPLDGYLGVSGQARSLQLDVSDLTNNLGRSFTYEFQWGDGTAAESLVGAASLVVSHVYGAVGAYTAQIRAIDPDGGASDWVTATFSIQQMELQSDVLAVGGTAFDDTLTILPNEAAPVSALRLNATSLGNVSIPPFGLKFFGGVGNDTLSVSGVLGNDTFEVNDSAAVWNGGATWPAPIQWNTDGVETLKLVGGAGDDQFIVNSGAVIIDGGTGVDRITGPDQSNIWQISGLGLGTLNGAAFLGVETLVGGNLSDEFVFGNSGRLTGTIDGGVGFDTLNYSARTTAVTVNLATLKATNVAGIAGIDHVVGSSAGTDLLTAPNTVNYWNLSADGSTLVNDSTRLGGFETYTGGSLADTFAIAPGLAASPNLNGGGGIDILSFEGWTDAIVVNRALRTATSVPFHNQIEQFVGGVGVDTLLGANTTTTWSITGSNTGTFSGGGFTGFEQLVGGAGNDKFVMQGGSVDSIRGEGGIDTLQGASINNQWMIDGADIGYLNATVPFSEMEILTGGSQIDTFVVAPGLVAGPTLNGGGGVDVLSFAGWTEGVTVNRALRTATSIPLFNQIEQFVGGAGVDSLLGANTNTTWSITGNYAGAFSGGGFTDFEQLAGGTGNDKFVMQGGLVDSIRGDGGVDTLQGANLNNQWMLDGVGAGSLNAAVQFSEMENLTGGSQDDLFEMAATGSAPGTLSGGSGVNTLSYRNWSSDVTVNTPVGAATAIGMLSNNFAILIGGVGNDSITAFGTLPSVLIGNAGNDTLTGSTSGRDILIGGAGADTLFGLGGDDLLVGGLSAFDNTPGILKTLHAEWKSNKTYKQRVDNLRGGPVTGVPLNGSNLLANLPVDTLFDDGDIDNLFGGTGFDWFIAASDDEIADLALTEIVDQP